MLTRLQVTNYQSLRDVDLELGRFTVITGATGSGKSAVLRAVQLLAFNARGSDYITRGAKSCMVRADEGDRHVAITRHVKTSGKDFYETQTAVVNVAPAVYTKLNGEVPDQVAALLQLSALNFTKDQFDRPFLLDASGGEVARVLGKLTNVTLLFDAAKEANRRRLRLAGDLKYAQDNLDYLTEQAQKFAGMEERHAAVAEAEAALARSEELADRREKLAVLADRLEAAEAVLARSVPPQVPSAARLDELTERRSRLVQLLAQLQDCATSMAAAQGAVLIAAQMESRAHEDLQAVLVAAGRCPTCEQPIPADLPIRVA